MNQFTDRYKLKSNSELIRIIQNSSEYQESALEAAKLELSNRGVSESEINQSQTIIKIIDEHTYVTTPIITRITSWLKNNTFEDNIILIISIFLSLLSLLGLYLSLKVLKLDIAFGSFEFISLVFYISVAIIIVSTVLFWKRNKLGWILLAIIITYSLLESVYGFLNPYNLNSDDQVLVKLVHSIILGIILYLICRSKIREIYKINENVMTHVILWTVVTVVIVYLYFAH